MHRSKISIKFAQKSLSATRSMSHLSGPPIIGHEVRQILRVPLGDGAYRHDPRTRRSMRYGASVPLQLPRSAKDGRSSVARARWRSGEAVASSEFARLLFSYSFSLEILEIFLEAALGTLGLPWPP